MLGVREAMMLRGEKFDWSKTWVAEMFLTQEEKERRRGVTREQKRNDEIRAGVITSFVGIGAMIFLYFFFDAVASVKSADDAVIARKFWLAGVVPFFIGIRIILNGLILGRRDVRLREEQEQSLREQAPDANQIPAKTTSQLAIADQPSQADFSVIEHTTAHLSER
ncbi:MAG: hypothetical protein ACREEM_14800 [Blastocatellia bacterium]